MFISFVVFYLGGWRLVEGGDGRRRRPADDVFVLVLYIVFVFVALFF